MELAHYENALAAIKDTQDRVKRLMYWIDDPDLLADLAGIMANCANLRRGYLQEMNRRKENGRSGGS